ncbi:solute carrier family 35 member G1-like isoform X2 [Eptesicus fuscus]|uniref:solute carrier family 35 member G1-like isoform X2 n=1 Tax=Eptesicus fuscus TaxID=29078 RepID=UPI002403B637|nr:solute carrier family 35 member G1-like isoform X2 [Eptesicus fuscus]
MRPLDSTGVAELREPGLPLKTDTSPSASAEPAATREEPAAAREEPAEAVETPGRSWCWLCRSSPCGSRAQPELGL